MSQIKLGVDIIVIAGISGSGKTTLAKALAESLGIEFIEADDFHSHEATQKMAQGIALNDQDRLPWLERLNKQVHTIKPAIVACSALKKDYRDRLTKGLLAKVIWISISPELAKQRVANRQGHFMPASLVNSQIDTAEQPSEALVLEAGGELEELLEQAKRYALT